MFEETFDHAANDKWNSEHRPNPMDLVHISARLERIISSFSTQHHICNSCGGVSALAPNDVEELQYQLTSQMSETVYWHKLGALGYKVDPSKGIFWFKSTASQSANATAS